MAFADGDAQVEASAGAEHPVDTTIVLDVSSVLTFSDLYRAEFLPLVRLAALLLGRVEPARDVVQDAFVQLHVRWATVRDPLAYVRRSVVNGCRSQHRTRARHPVLPLGDHEPAGDGTEAAVDLTLASLDRLNARERACIVLKYYADRTEQEIAALVGCRPGSVGPTIHRALAKLRADEGIERRRPPHPTTSVDVTVDVRNEE